MVFIDPCLWTGSRRRVHGGGCQVPVKRRRWQCCALGASSDDAAEQPPSANEGSASETNALGREASTQRPPSVVRVQLTVLLETTAAWLAARQRGAPRASARQLERVRRLPPFFRDTSKSAPPAVSAAMFAAGAGSRNTPLVEPDVPTRCRIVLFRAQTPEHAHSIEYLVRALVSHVPRMGIGAAVYTAEILQRCGRAEILVADRELAECCCGRLLADGIMANVEPLIS
ncbi:hypothetical protein CCYA_CCYA08G2280 [Cyanidiococcus yangmingshanensis]|nr:hypothetical protein CCYA_CCYA08G2280 [Cyanidiococcus yangmingshanensis]